VPAASRKGNLENYATQLWYGDLRNVERWDARKTGFALDDLMKAFVRAYLKKRKELTSR
jgi:hypothetical protein